MLIWLSYFDSTDSITWKKLLLIDVNRVQQTGKTLKMFMCVCFVLRQLIKTEVEFKKN